MSKILIIFLALSLYTSYIIHPTQTQARTTPEDILNSQKDAYNLKIKNYSAPSKQKLENLAGEIAKINKTRTDQLSQIVFRQGEILDEYVRRQGIVENGGKDGINRDLSNSVNNARYWITYAHEAVAYQAAKVYVFDLTNEKNLRGDSGNLISLFQSDLNSSRTKVINSQKILQNLLK